MERRSIISSQSFRPGRMMLLGLFAALGCAAEADPAPRDLADARGEADSTLGSDSTRSDGGSGGREAGGTTGGAAASPAPSVEQCTPLTLLAHGKQVPGDTSKYTVPVEPNKYIYFYFKAPWTQPVQALSVKSKIDNAAVVHHWLLYAGEGSKKDGAIEEPFALTKGLHTEERLVAGWTPGAGDWIPPPGVGMELPHGPNAYFVLEIHYYNARRLPNVFDASGVEICATTNLQPKAAGITWLGTEKISLPPKMPGEAKGTCNPKGLKQPVKVLRSWPHMHQLGTHMTTEVVRANGQVDVLIDKPFAFDLQASYPVDVTINPGDRLVTTCKYNNTTNGPVGFGQNSEQEMCYNFVLVTPPRVLTSGGLMGATACTE